MYCPFLKSKVQTAKVLSEILGGIYCSLCRLIVYEDYILFLEKKGRGDNIFANIFLEII